MTAASDVIIISSGFPRQKGMSRDDLLRANTGIVRAVGDRRSRVPLNGRHCYRGDQSLGRHEGTGLPGKGPPKATRAWDGWFTGFDGLPRAYRRGTRRLRAKCWRHCTRRTRGFDGPVHGPYHGIDGWISSYTIQAQQQLDFLDQTVRELQILMQPSITGVPVQDLIPEERLRQLVERGEPAPRSLVCLRRTRPTLRHQRHWNTW